jgi:hypothetical protein
MTLRCVSETKALEGQPGHPLCGIVAACVNVHTLLYHAVTPSSQCLACSTESTSAMQSLEQSHRVGEEGNALHLPVL